jgi:2-isopropylmalate synthase
MNLKEKLEVARMLQALKVDVIEAGFPIASPGDFQAVQAIAGEISGPVIAGLARAMEQDIDRAGEALAPAQRRRIHVFCATSEIHRTYKLKRAKEEIVRMSVEGVRRARRYAEDVEFSPEDAVRTEWDFLAEVVGAVIEAGATTVNIPDTVGYAIPEQFAELIEHLLGHVPTSAGPSSASTATTTWAWPWPTAWPPSRPAPGRWNAPSTASASAPATPPWRRSSWP